MTLRASQISFKVSTTDTASVVCVREQEQSLKKRKKDTIAGSDTSHTADEKVHTHTSARCLHTQYKQTLSSSPSAPSPPAAVLFCVMKTSVCDECVCDCVFVQLKARSVFAFLGCGLKTSKTEQESSESLFLI